MEDTEMKLLSLRREALKPVKEEAWSRPLQHRMFTGFETL